jgi:hypothetical protein
MDSVIGEPAMSRPHHAGGPDADDADVPATVVCARCGRADCHGCSPPEQRSASATTPWERRQAPAVRRLWQTAQLATLDGETFFAGLGDGSVSSALGFALTCEFLAIGSLAIGWFGVVYLVIPDVVAQVLADGDERGNVGAAIAIAIPTLAVLMVLLHVLWAGSLELGLRLQGAEPRGRHCLRYALYSCGWDLVTSPFGFVAGSVSGGVRSAFRELRAAVRVPRFATRAYLRRARELPEAKARRALALAAIVTGASVLFGAIALAVALVAAMV